MTEKISYSVIFILSNVTFPQGEGLHVQSTALIRALRHHNIEVGVIAMVRNPTAMDAPAFAQWAGGLAFVDVIPTRLNYPLMLVRHYFIGWLPSPLTRAMRTRVRAWPDAVVHLEGIALAPLLTVCGQRGTVMSSVDAWSLRQSRLADGAGGLKRFFLKAYSALSALAERRFFPIASVVHVVSAADAAYLLKQTPHSHIRTIPVALIDVPALAAAQESRGGDAPTVVFWGDIGVPHLRAGLEWLFDNVAPQIASRGIKVNWVVLGRRLPDDALKTKMPGARYLDWVEDLERELRRASVVVLPDKSGSGLKNRALHAMACGVPVLGTGYAFEGIAVRDGIEALVRDTAEDFTAGLVGLLLSPHTAVAMGNIGRDFVLAGYGLDAVVDDWIRLYQTVGVPNWAVKA